jgi:membrane-associated protein
MDSLVNRLIDFLEPFFSHFGYLIVFAGAFLEGSFVFGWLVPGTVLLLVGSFYAAQGVLSPLWVGVAAFVGCITGDSAGYYFGRAPGNWVVKRFGHHLKIKEGVAASERYFHRFGGVTVLFGRLIPGIDAFMPFTAGLNHMPFGRFMLYDVPSAFFYSVLFTFIGYFFGDNWRTIENILANIGWSALVLIVLIILTVWFLRKRRAAKRTAEEEGPDADETG